MKFKSISFAMLAAGLTTMLATSCANDDVTGFNPDPAGNALTFSPVVGHSSRATEIKIENLGDFAVVARGVHPHGALYNSYLIGDATTGGEIAHKKNLLSDGKGVWELSRNVYWPNGMTKVFFWAYTVLKDGETGNALSSGTFSFSGTNPQIAGFSPAKADLTQAAEHDIWADGDAQKDLLVAFKEQKQTDGISNIKLNFDHVLTQISIKALQKDKSDNDNRIVKVKGAWIVNAKKTGTLAAEFDASKDPATHNPSWSTDNDLTAYGTYYKNPITLGKTESDILNSSLMIIPQELTAWTKKDTDTKGAYIMLLCRIELEHPGTTHSGDDIGDVGIEGNNHYHQQFPVSDAYNKDEYGFVCVPVGTNFEAGKRYTYTLDICGATTGAGWYPPVVSNPEIYAPDATNIITTIPTGKAVGAAVLNDPIKFTVSVNAWVDQPTEWQPGNDKF